MLLREVLPDYLDEWVAGSMGKPVVPDARDVEGFEAFVARHRAGLAIGREALKALSLAFAAYANGERDHPWARRRRRPLDP